MQERFRIQKLHIKNYKGIDELELSFPEPLMEDDPDITVLGSRNGVGKTSVLECIAMLTKAYCGEFFSDEDHRGVIHGYAESCRVEGTFPSAYTVGLTIDPHGVTHSDCSTDPFASFPYCSVSDVSGKNPEPIFGTNVLFIHGYRKIREERINLGGLVEGSKASSLSLFKKMIVSSMMGKAGLFDAPALGKEPSLVLLDDLMAQYAGAKLGKLRPYPDGSLDIMISSTGETHETFPIDGLSSGQKEIISMLFMIYEATKDHPHIVLIDEPELHLNMEWHKPFMRALVRIAPHNQYIIATHSEMIMDSVEPENRIILKK